MNKTEKVYIGREEAWEIKIERGIEQLPRKGRQILTVWPVAMNKPVEILGHDENGYYLSQKEMTL